MNYEFHFFVLESFVFFDRRIWLYLIIELYGRMKIDIDIERILN